MVVIKRLLCPLRHNNITILLGMLLRCSQRWFKLALLNRWDSRSFSFSTSSPQSMLLLFVLFTKGVHWLINWSKWLIDWIYWLICFQTDRRKSSWAYTSIASTQSANKRWWVGQNNRSHRRVKHLALLTVYIYIHIVHVYYVYIHVLYMHIYIHTYIHCIEFRAVGL